MKRWNAWTKHDDKSTSRPYAQRYVGSLVADAHRTLLKGGVLAYPDKKNKSGKLRLLYEANPFAFIFEAAGDKATNGTEPILDIVPAALHQRTPLVLGSPHEVDEFAEFMRGERSGSTEPEAVAYGDVVFASTRGTFSSCLIE